MREVAKKFDNYWISAGTALGLYRDGDFIKGDTDIDIAMEGHDDIEQEVRSKMEGYGMVREMYHNGKVMQLAFHKDGVLVDIYFHWPEGENLVNHADRGRTIVPAEVYRKTKKIKTKYGILPFPNPPEKYFEIRYGKDWKVPQDKKPIFH